MHLNAQRILTGILIFLLVFVSHEGGMFLSLGMLVNFLHAVLCIKPHLQ